jgi:fructose-1,6-bisphosphatase/inositol monophosphatase family enzyme
MDQQELRAIHDLAVSLARAAGKYLRSETDRWRSLRRQRDTTEKLNSVDLVTESDLHVEKLIREGILSAYPQHQVLLF